MKYLKLFDGYTHKELDSRFWNNYKLDEGVREKLLRIAKDFFKSINIGLEIEDIKLTGSISNYNYTEKSDLDVHIVVDFSKSDDRPEILEELFNSKSLFWNLKHDINIRGADVELYVQDVTEEHISTGLYSLLNGDWIKKPEYTDPDVDEDDVRDKYNKWVYDITKLSEKLNQDISDEESEEYYKLADKMRKKIKEFRKKGLHEGKGEFSVENIVFKKLRNSGYLEKLFNSLNGYYDKMFSQ